MFRKTGNSLPARVRVRRPYAGAIADALRTELGQSHRAVKTIMKWTGASDRAAKNWLTGCYGPSGEHLVALVRESDTVLAAVLGLAGRHQHLGGAELLSARNGLLSALQVIDSLLQIDPT